MAADARRSLAGGALSLEAAQFFARVYASARAGSLGELRRSGCSEEEAEELFSASFERVMATVDPIERGFAEAQMVVFIKRACHRRLIDERRHRAHLKQIELDEARSLNDPGAAGPDEIAQDREVVAIGREALMELPERDRQVFRLRHELRLSPGEIVERTPGLSHRTYRKVIERANKRVLEAFERIDSGRRCAEMEGRLLARHVAGACSDRESRAVVAHLAHCRACQRARARMLGHLRDVAGGLGVAGLAGDHHGSLHGVAISALDLAGRGGQALGEATRAARERLRELAVRVGGGLPGSGGDPAMGQALGVSAAKVASVCGAGVVAGACVVAGIVPAVGGGSGNADKPASARESQRTPPQARPEPPVAASPFPSWVPPVSGVGPSDPEPDSTSSPERRDEAVAKKEKRQRTASSSPPRATGRQVGTEFGFESGASEPAAPSPPASESAGEVGTSTQSASGSEGSGGSGGGGGAGGGGGTANGARSTEFGF